MWQKEEPRTIPCSYERSATLNGWSNEDQVQTSLSVVQSALYNDQASFGGGGGGGGGKGDIRLSLPES